VLAELRVVEAEKFGGLVREAGFYALGDLHVLFY
jgi:hypothetical protein